MKINFKKNKLGFSLPELLIVMAIIAIMSGVMFAITGNNTAEKKLEAAAKEVEATINLAQNYALTGKDAGSGCSYTFSHDNGGGRNYNISGCSNYSYSLENGIHFDDIGGTYGITFGIPHGQASGNLRVVIANDNNTMERVVCVNSNGSTEILEDVSELCTVY